MAPRERHLAAPIGLQLAAAERGPRGSFKGHVSGRRRLMRANARKQGQKLTVVIWACTDLYDGLHERRWRLRLDAWTLLSPSIKVFLPSFQGSASHSAAHEHTNSCGIDTSVRRGTATPAAFPEWPVERHHFDIFLQRLARQTFHLIDDLPLMR
jgi:hypothetical protein